MSEKFDVIVIGAALNGLAMALALGGAGVRRPLKVALVDQKDPRGSTDARATALTQASRQLFETLGLWGEMEGSAQAVREIIVTDAKGAASERPALLKFDGAQMYLFENRMLLSALSHSLAQCPHVVLHMGRAVTGVTTDGPGLAGVTLADGSVLKASLVIAADGARSPTRAAAGIEMAGWAYDQMGLVASFAHTLPHGGRAEEHFGPQGPFAILPLTGDRSSIVWTCSSAEGKRLAALPQAEFEAALQDQVGTHLGTVTLLTPQQAYPLGLWIAKQFTAPRLALIGDAAHVVHPLAGLGFNLGLKDVAALAECLADAHAVGQDIGSLQVLERYAAWRRFDTVTTAASMDGFNRLFSNANPLLKLLRDAGLALTDKMPAAKGFFMREAAGLTGDVPKLMRGERL